MTREEINILQDIVDIYEKEDMYPLLKDRQIRTIKLAIKALEQEPCEDAVSRQAVKDLYCRICMEQNICYRSKENCEDLKLFDNLPSVQPKAKTGRREYNDIYDHYLCGNCKTIVVDYDNYCPNCGAEMKGVE